MSALPSVEEILERSRVVALPLNVKFRGVTTREALLIDGPAGWGEFSPFLEYGAQESSRWLASGIEAAWQGFPEPKRERVKVNGTIPAVSPGEVADIMARYPGVEVFKIKVAEKGQTIDEDLARIEAVRAVNPRAKIRLDANMGYTVQEAISVAEQAGPLDYFEQPVATIEGLREVRMNLQRRGLFVRVAADESIRKAEDPFKVADAQAADVAVVKVAPLGGVRATVELARQLNKRLLDITVSSELGTAVGINAGLAAVAALNTFVDDEGVHTEPNAAGLATQRLFAEDVAEQRVLENGSYCAHPVNPDPARLADLAAAPARRDWWFDRLRQAYALL